MTSQEDHSVYISILLSAMGFSKMEVSIHRSKWKFLEFTDNLFSRYKIDIEGFVHSGSSSEGMSGGPYYSGVKSDYDTMKILTKAEVVNVGNELIEKMSTTTNAVLLQEIPDKDYPGYVKLAIIRADSSLLQIMPERDGRHYLPNTCVSLENILQHEMADLLTSTDPTVRDHPIKVTGIHGPAVSLKASEPETTRTNLIKMLECTSDEKTDLDKAKFRMSNSYSDIDIVACVKSNGWPEEAQNWIIRPRPGSWPVKHTVEYIVQNTRVFLAPVGNKSSPDMNLQWRPSFNVAEKLLIESFNSTQIQCYALLKIFLKDRLQYIAKDILTSYCMKTTVFWLSELQGTKNMCPSKLLYYFVECLKLVKTWLNEGKLPHYFMESRNILRLDLDSEELSKLILSLDEAISNPVLAFEDCKSFTRAMSVTGGDFRIFNRLSARSILAAWLEMRSGIIERIYSYGTNYVFCVPYDEFSIENCIQRYRCMVDDSRNIAYGDPLLMILKSFLGFLCFANICGLNDLTEKYRRLHEAEDLLTSGKDGDQSLCPLKLATFYLRQNKLNDVLQITNVVLKNKNYIESRSSFMEYLYSKMYEHFQVLSKIDDIKILRKIMKIALTNVSLKAHDDEIIYSREECEVARNIIEFPRDAAKRLAFDAIFMLPEASALPRAARLELLITDTVLMDRSCKGIKLCPLLYTYYLRFLAFHALGDKESCLHILSLFPGIVCFQPTFYQARGYNLIASCNAMMGRSEDAAHCFVCSLQSHPSKANVAYQMFSFVYNCLLN